MNTFTSNILKSKTTRLFCAGLVATFLAGCADTTSTIQPTEGYDYRQTHAIKVTREQVSLSLALPMQGLELSPSDQRRFKGFLRDFVQRGRTLVTVESTLGDLAKTILIKNGLRANEIILISDTNLQAPTAVLTFAANKAVVPECGDWSSDTTFRPGNKPHSNYGCATQRNIGSVISDPGDLMQAQPATGGSAARTDAAIFNHQSGAVKTRLLDSAQ
ncbi:MAG: hypothetical protein COB46_07135 [Rhodospirillaceae bacterium]|nr:MAG: hypothetical protein COB46_07135 [Rhodospirillaceae bacterium]